MAQHKQFSVAFQLLRKTKNAVKNEYQKVPVWFNPMITHSPLYLHSHPRGKIPELVYPEDRLRNILRRRKPEMFNEKIEEMWKKGMYRWKKHPVDVFVTKWMEHIYNGDNEAVAYTKAERFVDERKALRDLQLLYAKHEAEKAGLALSAAHLGRKEAAQKKAREERRPDEIVPGSEEHRLRELEEMLGGLGLHEDAAEPAAKLAEAATAGDETLEDIYADLLTTDPQMAQFLQSLRDQGRNPFTQENKEYMDQYRNDTGDYDYAAMLRSLHDEWSKALEEEEMGDGAGASENSRDDQRQR